jgi:hypothetical protein
VVPAMSARLRERTRIQSIDIQLDRLFHDLVHLDIGGADHPAPFLGLFDDELVERGRRSDERGGAIVYRNRMPAEIVAIFEKHGFIWGGKWYHFDTMHFEFRPELLVGK